MSNKNLITNDKQILSFIPTPFVFCPLPVRDPKAMNWKRETGNSSLELISSKGIPFGKWGRISLTLLVTEALRSGNKELELGKVGEVLRSVGQSSTGGETGSITRITNQMRRIGSTYMEFSTINETIDSFHEKSFHVGIADEIELFWSKKESDIQSSLFQNRILLSDRFYQLITERSIPVDLNMYTSMNPMEQDVYSWLIRRMYGLRKPVVIKWENLYSQFGENITPTAKPRFRERFKKALYEVTHKSYKEAKIEIVKDGIKLSPSPLSIKTEGRIIT